MLEPHVMCAQCQAVFPADAKQDEEVTCPVCGFSGPPERVMRATGFPSLEVFKRNYGKVLGETLEKEP